MLNEWKRPLFIGFLMVICLALGWLIGCNIPTPPQGECWRTKGCSACVEKGCGWCESGCYSFKSDSMCTQPIGFIPQCSDSGWPAPVVNPMPYSLCRPDGGAKRAVEAGDGG